jgi:hypothetical protein
MTSRPAKRPGRRGLYIPILVFAVLIAAYSAYWVWARGELAKGVDAWIAQERAAGRIVTFETKRLAGYPFRFALHVDAPVYGDPAAGWRWTGETLQLVMQPWNWQHVIARTPGANRFTAGGQTLALDLGRKSAASLSWTGEGLRRGSLSLDRLTARIDETALGSAQALEIHLRPPPGEPDMLQLQAGWREIALARPLPDLDFLGTRFGPSILRAEAHDVFPALATGVDLADLPGAILSLGGSIHVPQLVLDTEAGRLGARARLARTGSGALSGALSLRLDRADALKSALEAADRLDAETRQAIDMLAMGSRDGKFVELSVRGDGLYFLGNRVVPADIERAL